MSASPERVESALRAAADEVQWPAPPDLAAAAIARIRAGERSDIGRPHRSRAWVYAAAAVALIGITLIFSPGARRAVADLFGIGGVVIEPDTGTAPAPPQEPDFAPGEETTLDQARAEAGWELGIPVHLGAPQGVFIDRPTPGNAIHFVYAPGPGLPEIGRSGVGLLLTQFPGRVGAEVIGKMADLDAVDVTEVDVDGARGYWISGAPHTLLYLTPEGQFREDTVRLARAVLIWTEGGVTFRLESALGRDRAIATAGSISP